MKTALQRILALAFVLPLVSGCISPKSYVDPTYGKVTYNDLTRRAEPYKWRIVVEFQRNGAHLPRVDSELLRQVERVVRASGMAIPTAEPNDSELKVIVNNVADLSIAVAKGFGTGLTFGLIGSTVSGYYEMEVVLTENDKKIRKVGYKHALHTTIGNASSPEGLEPMTVSGAFGVVVEQMMLNALKDLEREKQILSLKNEIGVRLELAASCRNFSALAVTLEELHGAFMLLGRCLRLEGSQVTALASLGILLP